MLTVDGKDAHYLLMATQGLNRAQREARPLVEQANALIAPAAAAWQAAVAYVAPEGLLEESGGVDGVRVSFTGTVGVDLAATLGPAAALAEAPPVPALAPPAVPELEPAWAAE